MQSFRAINEDGEEVAEDGKAAPNKSATPVQANDEEDEDDEDYSQDQEQFDSLDQKDKKQVEQQQQQQQP